MVAVEELKWRQRYGGKEQKGKKPNTLQCTPTDWPKGGAIKENPKLRNSPS